MKKRVLTMLLAATMVIGVVGCAKKPGTGPTDGTSGNTTNEAYELALITDVGTIDDKSFNQGSWEGVVKYAEENNIKHKYYKPAEKSDEACENAIALAVKGGAKVIVCPGFLFEVPVFNSQEKYPDVTFIFIDGAPHSGDYNYVINKNVLSIFYAEEQAGYLAGYAAVTEGYKKLGFMGGIAVPAVIRYGYGYIQGADAAAKDMGLAKGDVTIKYTYLGNFEATPENNAKAAAWYNEGTEVIFACGGGAGNSVMKAAETAGKLVIGVDVDQSSESNTVITSAMKNLQKSVYDALASFYSGKFEGGKSITLDASSEGIELPMKTSKLDKFTQATYDSIYAKLVDGSITIANDSTAADETKVPTEIVTVESIK